MGLGIQGRQGHQEPEDSQDTVQGEELDNYEEDSQEGILQVDSQDIGLGVNLGNQEQEDNQLEDSREEGHPHKEDSRAGILGTLRDRLHVHRMDGRPVRLLAVEDLYRQMH